MSRGRALVALALALSAWACSPTSRADATGGPRVVEHAGSAWQVVDVDLAHVTLELVGQRPGEPTELGDVEAWLAPRKRRLVMATNAGIFSTSRRPLGLHVQNGDALAPLSHADGPGNFFLKPNGVFWVDSRGAHVAASDAYAPHGRVRLATQSGPLLLAGGRIHPAFRAHSTSLKLRSGVGVDGRGHALFALSEGPVSFHAMATLFRDALHCPDALYLDGEISAMRTALLPPPARQPYGGILVASEPVSHAGRPLE